MMKFTAEELMERIGKAERKPLTSEQKAKLEETEKWMKSLSPKELLELMNQEEL